MSCLFVENLTVVDCAALDPSRGLVGQSWIVDLELEGALDAQSMVLDFSAVKKQLKHVVDESVDHTLLVPMNSTALRLRSAGSLVHLAFDAETGLIEHLSPDTAVTLLDCAAVNMPAVQTALQSRLRAAVPDTVRDVRITMREERIDGASYCYAHGLRKHDGHCQRIAHGHRSRLEVRVDGQRDPTLEQHCAGRWRDIYLGSRADVLDSTGARFHMGYDAPEGRFELTLPRARCDLLDTDTTVERIAEHLAYRCARLRPEHQVEVRAYEGVMKGAVARRVVAATDTAGTPTSPGANRPVRLS